MIEPPDKEERQRLEVEWQALHEANWRSGRRRQREMAETEMPPRTFRRAQPDINKQGRRGAKARARILRVAAARGMKARFTQGA